MYKTNNRKHFNARSRGNNTRRYSGGRGRSYGRKGPVKQHIDPSRYVKTAKNAELKEVAITHKFTDFDVHETLQANIRRKNFEAPTPIQDQAIPHALRGKDIIGIANTGTGKTLAFALPIINALIYSQNSKAIVIAPTRELAEQIVNEFKSLSDGTRMRWALLIGGTNMRRQENDLARRPNLVVGTPGRIKDHLERKNLVLRDFDQVVLDEVDRMLDMGFVNDMRQILSQINEPKQAHFYSATVDHKVRRIVNEFSKDPVEISVSTADTSDNVEQNIVRFAGTADKIEKLHELLIGDEDKKVLIFDDTRRQVENLDKELKNRGFKSDSIHGGKSQGQRKRALAKFKEADTDILVATDVAARGLDVTGISHVVNYSTPQTYDDYIHRIGRAGRAGRIGLALTFIN